MRRILVIARERALFCLSLSHFTLHAFINKRQQQPNKQQADVDHDVCSLPSPFLNNDAIAGP
jgi:hypothetical protein